MRLCLDSGCPTRSGRLSAAELLHWLFGNYPAVRATAGLAPFASTEGVGGAAEMRLRMGNAVLTLFEFGASRATILEEKQQLQVVFAFVNTILDRR